MRGKTRGAASSREKASPLFHGKQEMTHLAASPTQNLRLFGAGRPKSEECESGATTRQCVPSIGVAAES